MEKFSQDMLGPIESKWSLPNSDSEKEPQIFPTITDLALGLIQLREVGKDVTPEALRRLKVDFRYTNPKHNQHGARPHDGAPGRLTITYQLKGK